MTFETQPLWCRYDERRNENEVALHPATPRFHVGHRIYVLFAQRVNLGVHGKKKSSCGGEYITLVRDQDIHSLVSLPVY